MPYSSACHFIVCQGDDGLPTSGRGCDEGSCRWKALCLSLVGVSGTLACMSGFVNLGLELNLCWYQVNRFKKKKIVSIFQLSYRPSCMIYSFKPGGFDCFFWKIKCYWKEVWAQKEKEEEKAFRPQFRSDLISPSKGAALQVTAVIDRRTLLRVRPSWPPACCIYFPIAAFALWPGQDLRLGKVLRTIGVCFSPALSSSLVC